MYKIAKDYRGVIHYLELHAYYDQYAICEYDTTLKDYTNIIGKLFPVVNKLVNCTACLGAID